MITFDETREHKMTPEALKKEGWELLGSPFWDGDYIVLAIRPHTCEALCISGLGNWLASRGDVGPPIRVVADWDAIHWPEDGRGDRLHSLEMRMNKLERGLWLLTKPKPLGGFKQEYEKQEGEK